MPPKEIQPTPLHSDPPNSAVAASNTPSQSTADIKPIPPSTSPNRFKKLWPVLLIIVLIIIGTAGYLLHKKNKPAAVVTKKDIQILNVGYEASGEIPQYPLNYQANDVDLMMESQLFEGLVGFKDRSKIVPLLATSWSNPDDTTWIFSIRQGVKFHSGRLLSPQDIKFTLDYATSHLNANGSNTSFGFYANTIKQVSVSGSNQITIKTSTPDPVLLPKLAMMGIVDSHAKLGDYDAGTGPYIVKTGTTPTEDSLSLVAFNGYWGGHIYTKAVNIKIYQDRDAMATDAAAGKLDISGSFNEDQMARIKIGHELNVEESGLHFIGINTQRTASPLHNLVARQAMAQALNIPAILQAGKLTGEQASQIVPKNLPGYNPDITNVKYDPAAAKALLAKVPNLASPITFGHTQVVTPQVNEEIKELNAVGFNIQPIVVNDFGSYIDDTINGKYDLFTFGDTTNTIDGLILLSDELTGSKDYDNPQVDKLVSDAGSTLNATQRLNDMKQIAVIADNDKPIIPLYTQNRHFAVTKSIVVNTDFVSALSCTYFWQTYAN